MARVARGRRCNMRLTGEAYRVSREGAAVYARPCSATDGALAARASGRVAVRAGRTAIERCASYHEKHRPLGQVTDL